MTSRDPKGAADSTVGYPSDSLASYLNLVRIHFIHEWNVRCW